MSKKWGCLVGVGVVVGMVLLKQACDRADELHWQAEAARQKPYGKLPAVCMAPAPQPAMPASPPPADWRLIVATTGFLAPMQDSLPANRGAKGEADATYIVCAEPRPQFLKKCAYGSGDLSFPVNSSGFDLRLLTKRGDLLAKGTIFGRDYQCPAQMKRSQIPTSAVSGPPPTAVDIVQWVEKQVAVQWIEKEAAVKPVKP